jgi:hypothetical protein
MKNFPSVGIQVPDILLPKADIDLNKWAVIACDQFTSEPEYWKQVEEQVGSSPSTYNLILPEVMLGTPQETARIQSTQQAMRDYLSADNFQVHSGMILVERSVAGKTRHGLMLALDLEQYDFNKGSQSLIRATEGTILDRLPPRIRIREGASLELPHILVLIDDPDRTVIEPLVKQSSSLTKLYDFELMLGSGHLKGWSTKDNALEAKIIQGLEKLADPETFHKRYQVGSEKGVLLFAMGDGNHSLATAKSIWEKIKPHVGMDHPARYALVEIENVHDKGLEFEPIHRVLFDVKDDLLSAMEKFYDNGVRFNTCPDGDAMTKAVQSQSGKEQVIGLVSKEGFATITITTPPLALAVGSLQSFLDGWIKQGGAAKIDYVHGKESVIKLGSQNGNLGFYLPGMAKSDLFRTVILDGALPRKTFSMGEAEEKRFYMECRKIA